MSPSSILVSLPAPAACTTRNVGSSIPLRANAVYIVKSMKKNA